MKHPTVAIVIPVYNTAPYLDQCISSALDQGIEDIEIHCFENGSTDESPQILEEWATRDERIKVHAIANDEWSDIQSVELIRPIACEYLYRMDSDDYLETGFLAKLLPAFEENNLDMLFFEGALNIDKDVDPEKIDPWFFTAYKYNGDYSELVSGQELFCRLVENNELYVSLCMQICRKSFLESIPIASFGRRITYHGDHLVTVTRMLSAEKVMILKQAGYHRRMRRDSLMATRTTAINPCDSFEMFSEILGVANDKKLSSDTEFALGAYLSQLISAAQDESLKIAISTCEEQSKTDSHRMYQMLLGAASDARARSRQYIENLEAARERNKQYIGSLEESGARNKQYIKNLEAARERNKQYIGSLEESSTRNKQYIEDILGENARLKHQVSSYWHFIKDNTLPFVSVIIPYHNCASTIKDCLESVLAQSIHFIEVLCIDNNSCDGTNAIVQEFAQRDGRVKYLKEQEQGAGFARNAGIAAAKGIFIAFIDADDHYPSNDVLAKLFEGAINNGQKVCGGEVEFFGDTEGHVNTYNFERFDLPVKGRTVRYSEYQEFFFYQRFIYHHSLLKEGGIRFPPYLRYQDPPFFIQVMVAVGSFWALPMLSYSYRTKPVRIPKSDAEVRDTVRGVIDVMSVAKSQQLGIIQERLYRFFDYKIGMKEPIIAQLKKYDTDMASLMACAVRAADIELLQRAGVFFGREHLFVELPGILRNLAERNNSPLDGNQKSRWVKDADEIEQTWWENVKPNGENGET